MKELRIKIFSILKDLLILIYRYILDCHFFKNP